MDSAPSRWLECAPDRDRLVPDRTGTDSGPLSAATGRRFGSPSLTHSRQIASVRRRSRSQGKNLEQPVPKQFGHLASRDSGSEGPAQQVVVDGRRAVRIGVEPGTATGSDPDDQPAVFIRPADSDQTIGGRTTTTANAGTYRPRYGPAFEVGSAVPSASPTAASDHCSTERAGPPSAGCQTCSPVSSLRTHSPSAQSIFA